MKNYGFFLLLLTYNFLIAQNSSEGITYDRYENLTVSLGQVVNVSKFPNNPDFSNTLNSFEIPSNVGSNYIAMVSGYLRAPETGSYIFWVAADDFATFAISTNENINNLTVVASVPNWTSIRQWDKYAAQRSIEINLQQGAIYYVQALVKEGAGGDNLAVGWRKPSDGVGTAPTEVIPGSVLLIKGADLNNESGSSPNGSSLWSIENSDIYYNLGNVGIGTTNPDSKLAVNGNIHTKEVKVDLVGWSDFVFENDYKLPTLTEVEKHIKEKGHLKDMPSAVEVAENGILLGEMNSKLLQKIEELTLYTIQQQKEIEILKDEKKELFLINKKLLELQSRLDKLEAEK